MLRAVRLKPPPGLGLGDYDLDAVAVERDEGVLDFRFELGLALSIFWALPAGPGDRLRLAHVDGAAYHLDEPELVADPFSCDLPRLEWKGELGDLGDGITLTAVAIEMHAAPPSYRCAIETRDAQGAVETTTLAWDGRTREDA